MVTRTEAEQQIMEYLANKLSLDELEDWSAEAAVDAHNNPDHSAKSLIYSMRGLLNFHEDDDSEDGLKQNLLDALVEPSPSQVASLRAAPLVTEELRIRIAA